MIQAKSANRYQRFRAALALAGIGFADWAERHGVSRQHLHMVLRDERTAGAELGTAITAFISKYFPSEAA